jgi:seryl-tRNA synthetase
MKEEIPRTPEERAIDGMIEDMLELDTEVARLREQVQELERQNHELRDLLERRMVNTTLTAAAALNTIGGVMKRLQYFVDEQTELIEKYTEENSDD